MTAATALHSLLFFILPLYSTSTVSLSFSQLDDQQKSNAAMKYANKSGYRKRWKIFYSSRKLLISA
jgi:hypothetical protein